MKKSRIIWLLIAGLTFGVVPTPFNTDRTADAFTRQVMIRGSLGDDVYELQGRLRYVGYYNGPIDGKFGWGTYWSVRNFQRDTGQKIDGIVGAKTKLLLVNRSKGFHTGMYRTAQSGSGSSSAAPSRSTANVSTSRSSAKGSGRAASLGVKAPKPVYGTGTYTGNLSPYDINLLEHTVYSEARGEPFIGQVAVAACVLNRLQSPLFPHTIAGIVFQPGAFSSVADGQFFLQPNASAHRAVMDALQGVDPTGGALYYFNPVTATSKWIWSRPQIKKIGKHIFTR